MAIPAGYVRITLPFVGAAVPTGAANVLCFENTTSLDADAIQILWNGASGTDPWSYMSSSATCPEMLIKFGPDATGALETRACATAGSSGGAMGGAAIAVLIKKATALGGRRGRGRFFLPAIPEEFVDIGGTLDSTFVSGIQADTDTFFAALAVGGLEACVEHSDGATPTPVTAHSVSNVVATQRRRQRR